MNHFIKKSSVAAIALALTACGSDGGTKDNAPTVSNNPVPSAQEMEFFEYRVRAIDIDQQNLSFSVSGLPEWAYSKTEVVAASSDDSSSSATPNTATELVIYGTPSYDDAGVATVFVSVSDGVNETHADPIRIEIENTNRAPELNPIANVLFDELSQVSVDISAVDADGDDVDLYVYGLPEWLSFDAETQTISGYANCEASGRLDEIIVQMYDGHEIVEDDTVFLNIQDTVQESRCFSGKVLGKSYLSNALVYLDANNNGIADEDEPSTRSEENGSYTLVVNDSYIIEMERPGEDTSEEDEDEENTNTQIYDNYVKYPNIRVYLDSNTQDTYQAGADESYQAPDFFVSPVTLTADPIMTVPHVRHPQTNVWIPKVTVVGYNISPYTDASYQIFTAKQAANDAANEAKLAVDPEAEYYDLPLVGALSESRTEMLDNFLTLSETRDDIDLVTKSDMDAMSTGSLRGYEEVIRAMYGDYIARTHPLVLSHYPTQVGNEIYHSIQQAGHVVVSNKDSLAASQANDNSGN